jgi:hypothetical protein
MPRLLVLHRKSVCLALAILLGASLTVALRAEQPMNPLRRAESDVPALRVVPVATDPPIGSRLALADEPTNPPSATHDALGPPELLPSTSSRPFVAGDQFSDPDFAEKPWENLVHPLFVEPWFAHGDPNDPRRHIGIGQPLVGTSWRNRPLYFGTFLGGIMMDDLVSGQVYQNDTTFVGARMGYDFDHFWGLEGRWAFARPDLADGEGVPFFPASRNNFADVSLIFYPLGDARWRPYLVGGLGFTTFRFNNQFGERISEAALTIPLGFGVKYFYGPWFTLRFDFVDNLAIGNERINGMHNVSLMAGCEVRFGGRRPSYFPWHNNTTYW